MDPFAQFAAAAQGAGYGWNSGGGGGGGYGKASSKGGRDRDEPYSRGGGGGTYGGGGSGDDWGAAGGSFSDLGANLKDIDWSKENLQEKSAVSASYYSAAQNRSATEVQQWRQANSIQTWGTDAANPILSFEETGFPRYMLDSFYKQGFKSPTIIQSAAWGPAMQGRDIVGIAKTGSGKTIAFGIPGLLHISAQPHQTRRGDGPMMLVLAPTRELGQQIHDELKKVLPTDIFSSICYGGAPKYDQKRELMGGIHVLVATPGRLIDFLEMGVTNLRRVTYCVMDEADRMLDMGFEPDVRKIVGQCRPDRQTLLFSATWPKSIQRLANDFTKNCVHVQVGSQELSANEDITQEILETSGYGPKMRELERTLSRLDREGIYKVLIFAGTKKGCEELSNTLRSSGWKTGAIHGDKEQHAREKALNCLKTLPKFILCATDVAARGLDVPKLPAVINFDMPDSIEDYVHRIGRTGRAGNKGYAISFFAPARDCGHAKKLIDILQKAKQNVPKFVQDATFMTPPPKKGKGKGGGKGKSKGGGKGGW